MTNVEQLAAPPTVLPARPISVPYQRRRPPFPGILVWRPDAVSLLSVLVALTFVVPARFVVKGLGAVGTPANVLGIGLFLLWLGAAAAGARSWKGLQPVRVIIGIYVFVYLITYAGGFARHMFRDEASNATRAVIETFALAGIALTAADAIPSRERLNVLVQRLVYGAAFMAFIGDFEAMTKINIAQRLRFPGLVINNHIIGLRARGNGGLFRVAGTATHYIEFGVVLGMLLPLAIHLAIFSPTRGRRHLNWMLSGLIAIAVPFAISRSAAAAMIVGLLVLAGCWTWRARVNGVVIAALAAVGMKVAKPGLLGTIKSLFAHASSDPSITGRTNDYGPAFSFISERPWFGRGAGSFVPGRYRILDNQMLGTTIESGIVGLIAFVTLFVGGAALAHRVGKFSPDPETRHLGYALLAIFAVGFLTSFTFDSMGFPMFAIVLFLSMGIAGALWRLDRPLRHAQS